MADANNAYESPSVQTMARPPRFRYTGCIVAALVLGGLLSTWFAALSCMMDQSYQSWPTRYGLRHVVTALKQYHEDHGSFPPAVVTDASGKPLYSWRVLLLPYLPGSEDPNRPPFDLSQAWDSEANREASASHGSFDNPRRKGQCVIYALVGRNTMFPPDGCRSLSDVKDDPARTIVLVSVFGRKQSWAAPGDVNIDKGPLIGREIHIPESEYWAGSQVEFLVDGNAMELPKSVTDDDLRAAASIAGGEAIHLRDKK